MPFLSFLFPVLAHEGESMSAGEMALSVGLLVLSAGIAATMLLLIFLKPFIRVRRQWKEGRLPQSSKTTYLVFSLLVVAGFLMVVWKFAWGAYYDIHRHRYEEKLEASGKQPKQGVEYNWNRWHIHGRYGPDGLTLFVDDIFEQADAKQEIAASARKTSPSTTDWQPMTWDEKQRAFVAAFKPESEKMEFEFRLKSGWSSHRDAVVGYAPRNLIKGRDGPETAKDRRGNL